MNNRWKYLALTFIIGWFLGGASGFMVLHAIHNGNFRRNHIDRMRERFSRELKLTPEQKTRVDSILLASRQHLDVVFSEAKGRVEAVRNEARAQIRQLLSAEQQVAFDKLDAKMEARFERRLDRMHDRL